jgi:hypothetical protein
MLNCFISPFLGVLTPLEDEQLGLQYLKRACRTELDLAVFATFFKFNT